MSKLVKKMEIDALQKVFSNVRDMVFLASKTVDAALEYNFRKTLREKKIRVQMVKNTLARKVLESNGIIVKDIWHGTTLIAWGADSIKELSNTIEGVIKDIEKKDVKTKDKLVVKSAVADGQQVSFADAMKMPTRFEAIGDILNMILSPAMELASLITSPGAQIASQITTISERKEEPASAEVPPESTPSASA